MASPYSLDCYDSHTRKRVGKACDRCRLKKSKCDGASLCGRCKADNSICVFGERKKSQDKVYPKGYVEMVEQQRCQLVAGIREMYKKLLNGETWPGAALHDIHDGHPLTHDILERLDVLHMMGDNPVQSTTFEDDYALMQQRLIQDGASFVRHRRESTSSDPDPGLSHTDSPHNTPVSRSLSSALNSSSLKCSAPTTPTLSNPSQVVPNPAKRRHQDIQATEVEPGQLWQEPWVMQNQEMNDVLEAKLFDGSYNAAVLGSLYNPLSVNPLTAPSSNTMAQASMGNWAYQDPEFDTFMRSGYHGTLAWHPDMIFLDLSSFPALPSKYDWDGRDQALSALSSPGS